MKFRCEQFRVGTADSKDDKRAGIAKQRRSYRRLKLVGELVDETEVGCELARFREERRECVGPE